MKLYTPAANRPEDQGPVKPGPKKNAKGREGFEERQKARSRGGGIYPLRRQRLETQRGKFGGRMMESTLTTAL